MVATGSPDNEWIVLFQAGRAGLWEGVMTKVKAAIDGNGSLSVKSHDSGFEPAYLALLKSGELAERARLAQRHLEDCDLCARYCHVNRRETLRGAVCRTGEQAVVILWTAPR